MTVRRSIDASGHNVPARGMAETAAAGTTPIGHFLAWHFLAPPVDDWTDPAMVRRVGVRRQRGPLPKGLLPGRSKIPPISSL